MANIVCFGEVLYDVFPNGESNIGGAPLNVALRASSFEHNVSIISAIGNDNLGQKLLKYLRKTNVDTSFIQKKINYNTGEVTVELTKNGSATYTILHPSAWDKIEIFEEFIALVKSSDALFFGSLVCRDEVSKQTLFTLLDHAKYKILDLNLRPPHYTKNLLIDLMNKANFIKLNDEELYEVAGYFNSKYNGLEQNLKFIARQTNTNQLCVTKGAHGAVLLYNDTLYYNSGYQITVKDTVGAGDSFLATLMSLLLKGIKPQKALDMACGVGALVAGSCGANPKISLSDIERFINPV